MGRAFRLGALIAMCAALAILAAACGGGSGSTDSEVASLDDGAADAAADTSGDTTGSTSSDPEDALLKFAQCMRDNGVDVPDPTFDANGRPQIQAGAGQALDPSDPDVQEAMSECQEFLQGTFGGQLSEAEQQERQDDLLEFAQCLRDQGLDVEDPDFSQGGGAGGGGIFGGQLDPDDPQVQQAMEACQEILGDLGPPGGGGPPEDQQGQDGDQA